VRVHKQILLQGRTNYYVPPSIPEEDQEEYKANLEAKDPMVPALNPLNEDKPFELPEAAWTTKVVGDDQPYNQLPPREGTDNYAVLIVQNLRWPGAVTVVKVSPINRTAIERQIRERLRRVRVEERRRELQPNRAAGDSERPS